MYMISYEAIMLNGICLNCRATLKSESGTEIKRKWKQEMVKSGEAVLVEKFVSMGELPENAMLSFQIQIKYLEEIHCGEKFLILIPHLRWLTSQFQLAIVKTQHWQVVIVQFLIPPCPPPPLTKTK